MIIGCHQQYVSQLSSFESLGCLTSEWIRIAPTIISIEITDRLRSYMRYP